MSMRLLILGLLMSGDKHPYEIRQIIKEREMHHYMKLQMGSLYYAVDRLFKERLIEPIEVVKEHNRPDKTIYRITDLGSVKFQELLLQTFGEFKPYYHPLYAALPFAGYANQKQIAKILDKRIDCVEERIKLARNLMEQYGSIIPRGPQFIMLAAYEHATTELNWLRRLRQDAEDNRLGERGTPLDLK